MICLILLLVQEEDELLQKAKTQFDRKEFYEAYQLYNQFTIRFPDDKNALVAKKMKMETSKELVIKGHPIKFLGIETSRTDTLGIDLLRQSLINHPREEFVPEYIIWLGDYYFKKKQISAAETEYNRILKDYSKTNYVPEALFKLGECSMRKFDNINYDLTPLKIAFEHFDRIVKEHSSSEAAKIAKKRTDGINEIFAQKELQIAEFYLYRGKTKAYKIYVDSIVEKFPNTLTAEKIRKLAAKTQ